MFFRKKKEMPIGAKAKQARARQLSALGKLDINSSNKQSGEYDRVYSTLLIMGLAGIVAWRLEAPIRAGQFGLSGNAFLDEFVLAPAPVYMGDATIDGIIAMVVRAALIMGLAGIIPALGWMWSELIDRPMMSPYRVVWGMTLGVGVLALLMKPVFSMIMSNFVLLFS